MPLLWSEAINSLHNSLLEVLLEIRVHVLNKMSAYLYTNICLQLGCKTTYCTLQCNLYYSSQQRFSQGPPPCLVFHLSVLQVSLTLKSKQTDGSKWENSWGDLLQVVQQDRGWWASLWYIQHCPPGVAEHAFHKSTQQIILSKSCDTLIVLSRWWLELKQCSVQMQTIITGRVDKTRGIEEQDAVKGLAQGEASTSEQAHSTGRWKADVLL